MRMRVRSPWSWLTVVVLASSAHAQPSTLAAARGAYEDARFEDAVEEVARALDAPRLSHQVVVEALELRALATFALRDEAGVDEVLRQLAALAPERVLPPETPPAMREAWERARGSAESFDARIEVRREGDDVVAVVIANDLAGLVQGYQITLRGRGGRVEERGLRARLSTPVGGTYAVRVAALGPGGVVLAERRRSVEVAAAAVVEVAPPPPDRRRMRRSVAGVTVVVVAAMAVGVGLSFALRDDARNAVLVGPVP